MRNRGGKARPAPLALQQASTLVLATLAETPESLERFLALSGVNGAGLRAAVADPAFLIGVIDYALADEALLCLVATKAAMTPEALGKALMQLADPQAGQASHENPYGEGDVWIDP